MKNARVAPPLAGNVIEADSFVIAEWRDKGALSGPPQWIAPLHLHRNDDEAWYVLEGTLNVLVGSEEIEAQAGASVVVPRGTPHTYRNPGPGPVRYLLVMTPTIHRLIEALHSGARDDYAQVFLEHDSELLV